MKTNVVFSHFCLSTHPEQPPVMTNTAVTFVTYKRLFPLLQAFTPLWITTYVHHRTGAKKLFFRRLIKMQSLLILMCFGIKLNQQQQLGREQRDNKQKKTCSPPSILPNLQTTMSYRIDFMTAISIEIESLLVWVSVWEENISYRA